MNDLSVKKKDKKSKPSRFSIKVNNYAMLPVKKWAEE